MLTFPKKRRHLRLQDLSSILSPIRETVFDYNQRKNTTNNLLSNIVAKSSHSFFSVAGLDNQSIAEPAAGLFPNAASDPLVNRR